jgi:hypothetical protein
MHTIRSIATVAALSALFLGLAPACHHHRNDPDSDSFSWEFRWHGELDNFTNAELHEWDTFHERAIVDFEAWDFEGEIRVEIIDGDNETVYLATFSSNGGHLHHVDETDRGDDGDWHISIISTDAEGFVDLRVY